MSEVKDNGLPFCPKCGLQAIWTTLSSHDVNYYRCPNNRAEGNPCPRFGYNMETKEYVPDEDFGGIHREPQ